MLTTPRVTRADVLIAAGVLLAQTALAMLFLGNGHRLDALGWTLLTGSALVLVARRHWPMPVMVAVVAMLAPYHALGDLHLAAVPAGLVALYSVAEAGPQWRAYTTVVVSVTVVACVMSATARTNEVWDILRIAGWILTVVVIGDAVRIHRKYVTAIVERAERAERTREEEAARRVTEERMRIARDLHDLLAHSITLIGVQASVAAHVLVEDPHMLDRTALIRSLAGISETCRDARAELRVTLRVLREGEQEDEREPVPGLAGLPDLARSAEAAGALVGLGYTMPPAVSPSVGIAAYRIVQEALTNAVRHAPGCRVRVGLTAEQQRLRITVEDDGPGIRQAVPAGSGTTGYGLVGMRERARSVGGTLTAGPRKEGYGFTVCADLPLNEDRECAG
ncbi:sensor histidine kinase [Streptosporangium sp. NPDC051023]|uniref:sensor histidine kinase n=1 Tax=Streptosporangium sp. NPDC051023 TaxID=3155410 RepID=UPI00344E5623